MTKKIAAAVLMFAVAVIGVAGHAETARQERFEKNHPRRAEINERVNRQRRELKRQLKQGKITKEQYDQQMAALKGIKDEEHADVKDNKGSLTKDQQKALNQELNATHQEIKQDNAAPAAPQQH